MEGEFWLHFVANCALEIPYKQRHTETEPVTTKKTFYLFSSGAWCIIFEQTCMVFSSLCMLMNWRLVVQIHFLQVISSIEEKTEGSEKKQQQLVKEYRKKVSSC